MNTNPRVGRALRTLRLRLLPVERVHLDAFSLGRLELSAVLGVSVPEGWPQFPQAFARTAAPPPTDWPGYFFLYPKEGVLIGNGGFKGPPDASGLVEIGYEVAPAHQGRGFATEAVQGLLEYAFARPEVRTVVAHTLAENNASTRVLGKAGLRFAAEVNDPREGRVWRWRLAREDYASAHNLPPELYRQ